MKIDRHNYEEFFILYMDNELNAADRKAVELFIQENPDLKEELVMLDQIKMVPDNDLIFDHKEILMKAVVGAPVNMSNYQEWLLLYTDNELTGNQKKTIEEFAAAHPAVQKELELFQKTKLRPEENIVFPNKESLYRTEEKVRVVAIRWWRIAAAAVLIFAFGITSYIMFNNNPAANGPVAKANPADKTNTEKSSVNSTENVASSETKINETITNESVTNEKIQQSSNEKTAPVIAMRTDPVKNIIEQQQDNSTPTNDVQGTNNPSRQEGYTPNMSGNQQALAITDNNTASKKELIENNETPVTSDKNTSLHFTNAVASNNDTKAEQSDDNKGSVRGFLRKITRTFEKTTNIKATDDDDRLLVGGLAIKL